MAQRSNTESPSTWHTLNPDEVWQRLGSSERGLSAAEAQRRLQAHGPNRLPQRAAPAALRRLLGQFHNLLIYVLLAAAAITAGSATTLDTAVILGVVLINAVIGFVQEGKAERALEAVQRDAGAPAPRCCAMASATRSTPPSWCPVTWCCSNRARGCRPICGCGGQQPAHRRGRAHRRIGTGGQGHRAGGRRPRRWATAAAWPTPARW